MKKLVAFASIAGFLFGTGAKAAEPLDELERVVFEVCPHVFDGSLSLESPANWARFGLKLGQPNENGERPIFAGKGYMLRMRANDTNQVCHVTYVGPNSAELYEAGLQRVLKRDFVFVKGERSPPEAEFILDTLASESGLVGVVSMFRIHIVPPTMFTMTAMAPVADQQN